MTDKSKTVTMPSGRGLSVLAIREQLAKMAAEMSSLTNDITSSPAGPPTPSPSQSASAKDDEFTALKDGPIFGL